MSVALLCTHCGKEFTRRCKRRDHVNVYCSRKCSDAAKRRRFLAEGKCNCGREARDGRTTCQLCSQRSQEGQRQRRSQVNRLNQQRRRNLKISILNAYGGCICACCGETELDFLTLDHVQNDGADHRRLLLGSNKTAGGTRMYAALKRQGFPQTVDLQVLCANCHKVKSAGKVCPHKRKREPKIYQPFTFCG